VGKWVFGAACCWLLSGPSHAVADNQFDDRTQPPPRRMQVMKFMDRLTELSNVASAELRAMTDDIVDLRLNFRRSRGSFRVGSLESKRLGVALTGDILFRQGEARLSTVIHIAAMGHQLAVIMPSMSFSRSGMDSRSNADGDTFFLLEGHF
jgi:hypothetical protein